MNEKEDDVVLPILGLILMVISGLLNMIDHSRAGPIFIAIGMTIAADTFKSKKYNNRTIYNAIILAALAVLLIGEYFLVPTQNTVFYMLLLITAISTFVTFYFSFVPQNQLSKREKILSRIGLILFVLSFCSLIGIVYNTFAISFIAGVFSLIITAIIMLIGRRRSKDNAFK